MRLRAAEPSSYLLEREDFLGFIVFHRFSPSLDKKHAKWPIPQRHEKIFAGKITRVGNGTLGALWKFAWKSEPSVGTLGAGSNGFAGL